MIKNAWIDPAAKLESIEVHSYRVACSSVSAPCTWDETELLHRVGLFRCIQGAQRLHHERSQAFQANK